MDVHVSSQDLHHGQCRDLPHGQVKFSELKVLKVLDTCLGCSEERHVQ